MPPLLETDEITKRFFGIAAVDRVSLEVANGEIVGLIGPNGSGKTTLFNCITGHLRPEGGHVRKSGSEITHWQPHQVAKVGVARTFQTVRVFPELTTVQNLLVAAQQHQEDSIVRRFLRTPSIRHREEEARRRAEEALHFVGLFHLADHLAGELSYGQRKLLSFAATFVFDPDIILLDEPAAAVNPTMINDMRDQIRKLNERGVAFLIVEHNMEFIMGLAHRIVVLDQGEKIAEGDPASIQVNDLVLEAYFGR
jgi:ABC-type branched-subunit amino acid transport system ATPase component